MDPQVELLEVSIVARLVVNDLRADDSSEVVHVALDVGDEWGIAQEVAELLTDPDFEPERVEVEA